jgi:peptidoglycan hydrolase-like protein with peptidoglycan-binding domain
LDKSYNTGFYGAITDSSVKKYIQAVTASQSSSRLQQTNYANYGANQLALSTTTYPYINATFVIGTKGPQIVELQKYLAGKGYMLSSLATGYFGQITLSALTRYKTDMLAKMNVSSFCPVGFKCIAQNSNITTQPNVKIPQFTKDLKLASSDPEIANLQRFLNSKGFVIASVGAGSFGNETQFFGPATKNALTRFQNTNSTDILKTKGLYEGNGVFDQATRIYINSII